MQIYSDIKDNRIMAFKRKQQEITMLNQTSQTQTNIPRFFHGGHLDLKRKKTWNQKGEYLGKGKRAVGRQVGRQERGMDMADVPYICVWKCHNETCCCTRLMHESKGIRRRRLHAWQCALSALSLRNALKDVIGVQLRELATLGYLPPAFLLLGKFKSTEHIVARGGCGFLFQLPTATCISFPNKRKSSQTNF